MLLLQYRGRNGPATHFFLRFVEIEKIWNGVVDWIGTQWVQPNEAYALVMFLESPRQRNTSKKIEWTVGVSCVLLGY